MPLGLGLVVIGIDGCAGGTDSTSVASPPVPTGHITVEAAPRYVLAESPSMSLLDAQVAGPADPDLLAGWAFAAQGSPDDDEEPRPGLLFFDAAGAMFEAVQAQGTEIDAGGRTFWWLTEAENQRIYAGPTATGATIGMITLNVEEQASTDLLATAEWSDGQVSFYGERVPPGWIETGSAQSVGRFLAGATGTSTPPDGTRSLYGDPAETPAPNLGDFTNTSVVLATWPIQGQDPVSEARYSLDDEVEVEVRRADGTTTTGFASPPESEFFEFVVWQDGASWLALSRPTTGDVTALIDLAAAVRPASKDEIARLDVLAAD
jgi:hypothetical protein